RTLRAPRRLHQHVLHAIARPGPGPEPAVIQPVRRTGDAGDQRVHVRGQEPFGPRVVFRGEPARLLGREGRGGQEYDEGGSYQGPMPGHSADTVTHVSISVA